MGNKTECTGFLARATIKPETKAGLDKTESIMVRRPSLKWNFHAGSRTSMKVDRVRPAWLFVFHFLLPSLRKHSLGYLRNSSYFTYLTGDAEKALLLEGEKKSHVSAHPSDVGAQEYFAPQPSLFYRFYGPMPAASSGRKES